MSARCELPPAGIAALITGHARAAPQRTALVHPDRRGYRETTYGELARRVAAIAAGLAARGVGRGDRVVVLVPMSPELYATLLAIVSLGAVAVFVEPSATLAEFARAITVTRPRAFVGVPKAHLLRARYADVARVPVAIAVAPEPLARALGAESLARVEADGAGAALPEVAIDPEAPALLTFSSGSTGVPKGATRSHAFLLAQHRAIEGLLDRDDAGRLDRGKGDVDVDMSAFAIVLISSLVRGATAVIPRLGKGVDDVDGAALAAVIDRLGVSVLSGSPAFLAPIFDAAIARGRPLASLRRVVTGGAPVPAEMCEHAPQALGGGSLLVVYGSTEAEPIATIDAAEVRAETAAATRAGRGLCVGMPHPEIDVELVAPRRGPLAVGPRGLAGMRVAAGEVGEVIVAGDHVNERYYRNAAAERETKIVAEDGRVWHRTGDAAYRDARGRLWIVGRVADIVRRGDAVYHPAAVEASARALRGVSRAALIEDGAGGSTLVVERRGLRPGAARVTEHMRRRGVAIDGVRFARRLPVDPRHRAKLDYPAIRARYARPSRSPR